MYICAYPRPIISPSFTLDSIPKRSKIHVSQKNTQRSTFDNCKADLALIVIRSPVNLTVPETAVRKCILSETGEHGPFCWEKIAMEGKRFRITKKMEAEDVFNKLTALNQAYQCFFQVPGYDIDGSDLACVGMNLLFEETLIELELLLFEERYTESSYIEKAEKVR